MSVTPPPVSPYDQTGYFAEHVRLQPVKRWCTFTLAYPRWSSLSVWEICLRKTFREFDNRLLKGRLLKQNAATCASSVRRVVTIGGNPENGVAYHAQGLIDGIADNEYLIELLTKTWHNNARRTAQCAGHTFHAKEAKVYLQPVDHQVERHLNYLLRKEDQRVGWGVDKVLGNGISYLTETNPLPFS
jgi:hypothetical protein